MRASACGTAGEADEEEQVHRFAAALKRVYGVDVLQCARCAGRLVVLAFIEKLTAVRAILDHLGLLSTPLPLGKARGPPQVAWGF